MQGLIVCHAPSRQVGETLHDGFRSTSCGQEIDGLFERGEIVGRNEHGSGPTVTGDHHPIVGALHASDVLRETVLHLAQRHGRRDRIVAKSG